MKKERILSYKMSTRLSEADLNSISGASMRSEMTAGGSYGSQSGYDASVDVTIDA